MPADDYIRFLRSCRTYTLAFGFRVCRAQAVVVASIGKLFRSFTWSPHPKLCRLHEASGDPAEKTPVPVGVLKQQSFLYFVRVSSSVSLPSCYVSLLRLSPVLTAECIWVRFRDAGQSHLLRSRLIKAPFEKHAFEVAARSALKK